VVENMAEREGFYTAVSAISPRCLHFRDNTLCLSGLQANPNFGYSFHSFRYCLLFHSKTVSPVSAARVLNDIAGRLLKAIRAGRHRPHPKHWKALAELVGVFG
jgi:hypothetical protein